jgi:ArsR family transcriptional regulator
LSEEAFRRITRAIADPQRFEILVKIASQDELPCKSLVASLSIKQATISHHLKELTESGLIRSRKAGQRAILSCCHDVCKAYIAMLEDRMIGTDSQD